MRLALPAFGALVAEPLYVLTDTAIVGHLGTEPLGGLAVASTAILTGYAVFIFLAYGTTGAVGRLIGSGDEVGAARQAVQSLWLALGLGIVVALVGLAVAEPVVGALGATGEVREQALIYLRLSLPGVPALLLVLAGTGYLRGRQDTRTPLAVAVGTVVLNLVLEVVFVYGLDYGIGGSAVATVIAQWVRAATVYVVRIGAAVRTLGVDVGLDPRGMTALLRAGRDLLVRTAALRGALVLATAVATRIGPTALAAHAVAFEIWNALALGLDAIAIAGQAMVAHALGTGRVDEARAIGRRLLEWGVMAGAAFGVVLVALRPLLPGVFTDDAAVADLAAFLLWHVAALQPMAGVVFVLDGILIGAGDLRFLAVAMVGALAAFAAANAVVLGADLGVGWLWGAFAVLTMARLVPLLTRFARGRWAVAGATR